MGRGSEPQCECEPEYTRSELDAMVATPVAVKPRATSYDDCVDELLEWIEEGDAEVRFVPDWSGESYKNAA